MWGMFPPRFSLLGLRPAVSSATPSPAPPKRFAEASWVRPGTVSGKIHPPVGRTRGEQLKRNHEYADSALPVLLLFCISPFPRGFGGCNNKHFPYGVLGAEPLPAFFNS
jgi:hypothetical protein